MKKLLMGAVALAAISTTPAVAADPSASYTVSGTVGAACGTLSNGSLTFANPLNINATGFLADSQSASSSQTVWCNGVNSKISVAATAMTNQTTNAAENNDFTGTINFTTAVDFAGSPFALGTNQTLGAKAGTMTVSASALTANNGKRPYAGDYSGTITVTLSPAA
jgi:hypothetical protein